MNEWILRSSGPLRGSIRPASDKSLTHRAFLFAAFADGPCFVRGALRSEDTQASLDAVRALGLDAVEEDAAGVRLVPRAEWRSPGEAIDCGNSGTTMRLLAGAIAGMPVSATLTGDASLSRRPMKRVAEPLRLMGADIHGDFAPITVRGGDLKGIEYHLPMASAQVKSAILLAGLHAEGPTTAIEPAASRDHTERFLKGIGAQITEEFHLDGRHSVTVQPTERLAAYDFTVPADISSAAFWMVAATLVADSEVRLEGVNVNRTRSGILDVFAQCGVNVRLENERFETYEPVADLIISATPNLKPFEISGDLVPRLIDEIPVLAVLATQCDGTTIIRNARELRVKETDRIATVAMYLRAMGVGVETFDDGMAITGPRALTGDTIDAAGDHRLAMAFAVASMIAEGETKILNAHSVATSYPDFDKHRRTLQGGLN